jgi:hypothetical protein
MSILAMAAAEESYPWGSIDSQSATRRNLPFGLSSTPVVAAADPQCEPDEAFFQKGIGQALLQHHEFDGSNVKIALGRNTRFFSVDQPFSHAANELSLAEVDVEEEPHDEAETKAEELRAKIRAKHAWKADHIEEAEKARKVELKMEADTIRKSSKEAQVDVYYVNMDNAHERKNCLERQFRDMPGSPQPKRYSALKFPEQCAKAKTNAKYEECLKEAQLDDCFESGIDYAATGTHGTQVHDQHKIRNAVLSNWCGHKRLFKQLEAEAKNGTSTPEYVVVLEDDVILDRKYFLKVIKDFAKNYHNRDWDVVQLDPFGHKDRKDLLEQFRGKPVFKPTADSTCSAYWGFHAVLVKTSALHRINHWMSINQAVPIDWLPWRMPHVLAYSALVSRNPEATLRGGTVVLPHYCSSKVMKSTIG